MFGNAFHVQQGEQVVVPIARTNGIEIAGWQPLAAGSTATKPLLVDPADARDNVGQMSDYPELFTRWFEYGTFLPTLRLHGLRKNTEIWAYGHEAEAILAKYDRLRYQLIPYLYSLAKATYDTGAPFMRPLWMDFPGDPAVVNIGTQYMFGPDFLVAPVTEQGQTVKDVYLPAGADWYNYWTEEKFTGGRWLKVTAPIDQIPLFVRAGSILPLGSAIASTATRQTITMLKVYPGADAVFTLYDDDGTSYAYQQGHSSSTVLHWNEATRSLTAAGDDTALARAAPALLKIAGR